MYILNHKILKMGMLLFGASCSGMAFANQTVCVFDLQGKAGEIFKSMEEWALSAKTWNANIKLIPLQSLLLTEPQKSKFCSNL